MNEKSMGAFLAALRKEKGITQRELAEFLNVSDKTVSHWECDENSPDLSMLPIIAEYFGVTCDELIKGERKEENDTSEKDIPSPSYSTIVAEKSDVSVKKEQTSKISKAYFRHKIISVASIFASVFLIAASMLIIKIVEMISYSADFECIALIFSMTFFPCLCVFITLVSRHIFINTVKNCNLHISEVKKWKRKANIVCAFPSLFSAAILFIFFKMIIPSPTANLTANEPFPVPHSAEPDVSVTIPYSTIPYSADIVTSSGTVEIF